MKTLSKKREEELIEGVKAAVDLVDSDGMSPDDAIEKVARENKWGKEMVKFASCAYNTGRQTAQRETNNSILDKFAEFALADPDKITKAIWPKEVKSAAVLQAETGISDDYSNPPPWLGARQKAASMEKIAKADAKLAEQPKAEPYQPDPMTKAAKTYNQYVELRKEAEEARYQAANAYTGLVGAMGRLGAYFKKFARDRLPFATVEHVANLYFPKSAKVALDYVYIRNKMKEKRAADTSMPTRAIDRSVEPFPMIKKCVNAAIKVARLRRIEKEAADAARQFKEKDLSPFVRTSPRTLANPGTSKYLIAEDTPVKKAAGFMSSVAGSSVADRTKNILDRALSDAPIQEARQEALTELSDPEHEAELRRIRAQALIAEMMDDPIIGGHDPNEVLRAYNEISQLSPQGAMQPIIARSLLQRHLQGRMEPFEAKEITDIEKGVRGTETPSTANMLTQPANAII